MTAKLPRSLLAMSIVFFSSSLFAFQTAAQTALLKQSGTITFFSSTPVEDIKADNSDFSSTVNISDSSVVFRVPIKGFIFRKKLMQEHFNDQYMESKKYPSAHFTGKLGRLPVSGGDGNTIRTTVKGKLTIKDISREIDATVQFNRTGSEIIAFCEFFVRPADYGIRVPKILIKNIAEEVKVTINVVYK